MVFHGLSRICVFSPKRTCSIRDQHYCGDIINLKTYSRNHKDKRRFQNPLDCTTVIQGIHESIIDRVLWDYIQTKLIGSNKRSKQDKQFLFSGFLRCGDCGSNLHYHLNQSNPSIEYYSCTNYTGNRGTCPNTHYVRQDYLTAYVLLSLNSLIRAREDTVF